MGMFTPEVYLHEDWGSSWARTHSKKKKILTVTQQEALVPWLQLDYSCFRPLCGYMRTSVISGVHWSSGFRLGLWAFVSHSLATPQITKGDSSQARGLAWAGGKTVEIWDITFCMTFMQLVGWKPEELRLYFVLFCLSTNIVNFAENRGQYIFPFHPSDVSLILAFFILSWIITEVTVSQPPVSHSSHSFSSLLLGFSLWMRTQCALSIE